MIIGIVKKDRTTDQMGIKQRLHEACVSFIEGRISVARQAMDAAQESANSEEKSSAGDKYETGRAMAQIARDQAAEQMAEALKLKSVVDQINLSKTSSKAALGSIVVTDQGIFFISISAGELDVEGTKYLAVSSQSPIGKALLGRSVGEKFSFNKREYTVKSVE